MKFKADKTQAVTMQISNDAFFYLLEEEPPLDEANLQEALDIVNMFPHGFYIDDQWEMVEDSDLIEVTFIPYVPDDISYDAIHDLTKYLQMQIKYIDTTHIDAWIYNSRKCTREFYGTFEIKTNQFGLKYFHKEGPALGSIFYLKHFTKA